MPQSVLYQQFDKSDRLVNNHEYIFYLKEYIYYSFSSKMIQTSKSHILIPDPVSSLSGTYLIKSTQICRKLLFRRLFNVSSLLMTKIGNTLNVTFTDFVRHICYNMYLWGKKKRNL